MWYVFIIKITAISVSWFWNFCSQRLETCSHESKTSSHEFETCVVKSLKLLLFLWVWNIVLMNLKLIITSLKLMYSWVLNHCTHKSETLVFMSLKLIITRLKLVYSWVLNHCSHESKTLVFMSLKLILMSLKLFCFYKSETHVPMSQKLIRLHCG